MRKTKEEADITRQRLLEAALKVFSHQGYASTRLEDIAAEAEVTRGAIYHHFGGKAELYNAMVGEISSRTNHVIAEAIEEGGPFLDICRRMMIHLMAFVEENREFRAVMELTLFKTEMVSELESGLQKKAEATQIIIEQMSAFIRQGIESGEVRADLDPVEMAWSFLALQNGLIMTWLQAPRAFSLRETAPAAAEIFVNGISNPA
jgi:TetR/AcrR family transcriptional regulator, acrAB operon repressor